MVFIFIFYCIISINNLYKYNQIMQQQFYSANRYLKIVLKENNYFDFINLLLGVIVYIVNDISFYYLYLLYVLIAYFPRKRKSIIKLKITNRIKRVYICFGVFMILYAYLINLIPFRVQTLFLGLYVLFYKYIYLSVHSVSFLIELLINRKYLKKAKKKLLKYKPKIIAITGSFGKTSTKEYLNSILSTSLKVIKTPKSYNTLLGITSFINNNLNDFYDYIILEVGVDKKGGMDKFLKLFKPNITLITGIAPQHLSTFKTIENIYKEKIKLADSCLDKAFINGDIEKLIKEDERFIYCYSKQIKIKENKFEIDNIEYETNLFGEHLYMNLFLAIKVALYLKVNDKLIKESVKKITNFEHRFQPIYLENGLIIDDSYNSNFYSFNKALDSVSKINKYKILITPGLIELGDDSYKYNSLIAKRCLEIFDKVYLVGNNFGFKEILKSTDILETFSNFEDAYKKAISFECDKVILIENDLPDCFIE